MTKQVKNEIAVLRLAQALKDFDDCNPDVGMGPSNDYFIEQAARQLSLETADYDAKHVEDLMRAAR
ncbi:hypothetical protein B7L88_gp119 [Rhizobium phage RHEph10]|uniref:hypothetical protein n=1 Tax=Rhizobium phage RHEph10 TaxID=1220717 RepID=UPI0002AAF46B|nr:hypothetical protein B7L88_gp119 [Rhizobium phage RHEph10]AGC36169.1 hypothetical protein RHEph10_gp126 [Rhizobium phage RHEph10]